MAEFKTIDRADIIIPDRLREVDEDHALILSVDIEQQGLINPITVRKTPPATKPFFKYTLIAGAHRMRAVALLKRAQIDAVIVEAGATDAMLLEISENLFRNELTALDRSVFVLKYREAWEEKHGKIQKGGDRSEQRDKLSLSSSVNVLDAIDAMEGSTFFESVATRLGIHPRSVKRSQFVGQKLLPALRSALRGTPEADNQQMLLKLAGMEPDRQKKVALSFSHNRDIKAAIDLTEPNAKKKAAQTEQQEMLARLLSTWGRADDKTKAAFLKEIGAAKRVSRATLPTLTELLEEVDEEGLSPDPNQVTIFDVMEAPQ